jgi:hypothetical protein
MGSVIAGGVEYSNPARELPEGVVRSVTVMSSEPDVNPAAAVIDAFMEVEVPPDLVMGQPGHANAPPEICARSRARFKYLAEPQLTNQIII